MTTLYNDEMKRQREEGHQSLSRSIDALRNMLSKAPVFSVC